VYKRQTLTGIINGSSELQIDAVNGALPISLIVIFEEGISSLPLKTCNLVIVAGAKVL
jgi:hypothetical protein